MEKAQLELFRQGELELKESEEDHEDPKATIGASASPIAAAIAGSSTGPNGPNTTPGGNSDQSGAGGAASSALQVTSTPYQGSTLNVHPLLSSMVNYTTPQKFQGTYRVSQQVWNKLNIMFWNSEKFASYTYKVLTQ